VNIGDTKAAFTIILHRADGAGTIRLPDVLVPAGEWFQIGRILAEKAPGNPEMFAEVSVSPIPPFTPFRGSLIYAVINDGAEPGLGTGDGSYVPAQAR
jgi:hypothetical protein